MVIAMEECNEVAQRLSKALRFTLEEVQPGQDMTNAQRIRYELADLIAVLEMIDSDLVPLIEGGPGDRFGDMVAAKKAKVEKFLLYSEERGALVAGERP